MLDARSPSSSTIACNPSVTSAGNYELSETLGASLRPSTMRQSDGQLRDK